MAVRIVSFVGLKNERFSERYFIVGQKKNWSATRRARR